MKLTMPEITTHDSGNIPDDKVRKYSYLLLYCLNVEFVNGIIFQKQQCLNIYSEIPPCLHNTLKIYHRSEIVRAGT